MKLRSQVISIIGCLLSVPAWAYTPYADSFTFSQFLQGSWNSIPDSYFSPETLSKAETGNSNSQILNQNFATMLKAPYSSTPKTYWQWSVLGNPLYPGFYNPINNFPSFSERGIVRGQCVAFAKTITYTPNIGTGRWHSGEDVMDQLKLYSSWSDPSSYYQGRMVAYFGKPWGSEASQGTQYPQGNRGADGKIQYGHVGIFLKYAYKPSIRLGSPRIPIGFWILDENYEGGVSASNSDGKIRKHLILLNPSNTHMGHAEAGQYHFVDIW